MLKSLSKFTVLALLWQRYKSHIKPLLAFLAVLFVIFFAHSEYLSYSKAAQDNSYIGVSFLIKWLAVLLAAAVYMLMTPKVKGAGKVKSKTAVKESSRVEQSKQQADPFATIRAKSILKSKADFVIEGKQHPGGIDAGDKKSR